MDGVELSTVNSLERHVGQLLDKQEQILWWFRNKASKGWYAIQGWHEYKIRPDFIAAKKTDDGKLELVYIIESKGEHLAGNADSEYKKAVLDFLSDQHKKNRIERHQTEQLDLFQVNEHVECYFVEENKEDDLRKLFK